MPLLILGQRINEAIDITVGDVTVTIYTRDIRSAQVRLGIEAPAEVRIVRRSAKKKEQPQ